MVTNRYRYSLWLIEFKDYLMNLLGRNINNVLKSITFDNQLLIYKYRIQDSLSFLKIRSKLLKSKNGF